VIEDKECLRQMAEKLKVIAHPVRLCIVRGLWRKGCCNVTFMQECLGVPQSTVSQHLGKLRQAGIIEGQRQGLEICYSLKDPLVEKILAIMFEEECKQEF